MGSSFLRIAMIAVLLAVTLGAEESISERRRRVQEMTESQKVELFRNEEKLHSLGDAEIKRIFELHKELETAPDGPKLRETMNRYCQWLSTLPPYRRAELQDLKPSQRVKHIKQMLKEQSAASGSRLGDQDRQALVKWMDRYATAHESRVTEVVGEKWRSQIGKLPPPMRHRAVLAALMGRWQSNMASIQPPISESEMADLRGALSPEANKRLAAKPSAEQGKLISTWLADTARRELKTRRGEGSLLSGFDEQLADFFEFQISDEERDRLMSLPGEEMQQRLRDLYMVQSKNGGMPDPSRRGEWPPNWRGKHGNFPTPPGGHRPRHDKDGRDKDVNDPRSKPAVDAKGSTSKDAAPKDSSAGSLPPAKPSSQPAKIEKPVR